MAEVGVHEAKTHLSELLRRVALGEEITITSNRRAVARLVPARPDAGRRAFGTARGAIIVHADFDAPLPDHIAGPLGA